MPAAGSVCQQQDLHAKNCLSLAWTDEEKMVVDNAWDHVEAVEAYRLRFGTVRSFGAIKMRWYRAHKKRPDLQVLLEAFLEYVHEKRTMVAIETIQEFLKVYEEDPEALIEKGKETGWLPSCH
jgi:predicted nucleotidyltransferase